MSIIESMDFEDISDEDFNRESKTKKIKPTFDPDKVSPGEVIGNFSRQMSKDPEEKLIAEEEAKEIEVVLRKKYNVPEWMGLEEIARRLQAGENLRDIEDAVKEAVEVEKEKLSHEKNKFHRDLALNGEEITNIQDEGDKITPQVINGETLATTEEIKEVITAAKEKALLNERPAVVSRKRKDGYDDGGERSDGKRGPEPIGKHQKGKKSIKVGLK